MPVQPGLVAAVKTSAKTILDDIQRLMDLAGYKEALPAGVPTLLKINISWHHYYPACSTTPWQLDGVTRAMLNAGWTPDQLIPAQNSTVVVDPVVGSRHNPLDAVVKKHGLGDLWVFKKDRVEWINDEPKGDMLCLPEIFPDGIRIPKVFIGKNALHMPTVKTHVFTT